MFSSSVQIVRAIGFEKFDIDERYKITPPAMTIKGRPYKENGMQENLKWNAQINEL